MGADGRGAATIPALALLYVLWLCMITSELLSRVIIHKLNAPWLEDGEIRQMRGAAIIAASRPWRAPSVATTKSCLMILGQLKVE